MKLKNSALILVILATLNLLIVPNLIAAPGIGGGHSYYRVKTAFPVSAQTFSIGQTTHFNQIDVSTGDDITNMFFFFDVSYAFTDNVDMYAELPIISRSNGDSQSGLADAIVGSRFVFPGADAQVFRMGLDLFVIAPTGADEFTSESTDFVARAIFDFRFSNFALTLNSGYKAVEEFSPFYRNQLLNGLAFAYISPTQFIEAGVEMTAETAIQDEMDFMESPVRISPFFRLNLRSGLGFLLGGDFRISEDTSGEPDWGVSGGVSWTWSSVQIEEPQERQRRIYRSPVEDVPERGSEVATLQPTTPVGASNDMDNDTIPNMQDQCPQQAEDFDGYMDDDGCPDADNDNDGLAGTVDCTPDHAEVFNNFKDEDGIPDGPGYVDTDVDGIPDQFDEAPYDPEDFDEWEDCDGVPDPDNDGDGILDIHDTEPFKPGKIDIADREDWNPYRIPANEPRTEDERYRQPVTPTPVNPAADPAYTYPPTEDDLPSMTPGATSTDAREISPSGTVTPGGTPAGSDMAIPVRPTPTEATPELDTSQVPSLTFPMITFEKESSDLSEEMLKEVEKIAKTLINNPRVVIGLSGYSLPDERLFTPQSNLGLDRAEAVKRQLILAHGISSKRMETTGVELVDAERSGSVRDRSVVIKPKGQLK